MTMRAERPTHLVSFVAAVVGVLLLLGGCGGDDTVGTGPGTPTPAPAPGTSGVSGPASAADAISLDVRGGTREEPGTWTRRLTCDNAVVNAEGIDEPAAACAAVRSAAGQAALFPDPGLVCTQQYGGPEVAEISGSIGARTLQVTVTRSDGCGIAAWDALQPLLPPPGT